MKYKRLTFRGVTYNDNFGIRLCELEDKIENGMLVEFPKLEKDLGHKGWWIIYSIDEKGDIQFENFEATKEEAEAKVKENKEQKLEK